MKPTDSSSLIRSIVQVPPEVAAAVDDVVERMSCGENVRVEELCEQYPDFAGEIRNVFPCLSALAELRRGDSEAGEDADLDDNTAFGTEEKVLGDFRIIRELGRGGMGVVYEAEELSLRRRVALKVLPFAALLSPRHLERFRNEARAAAMLKHPQIVSVHSVGNDRGVHYYAMELVEGVSLADVISQLGSRELKSDERQPLSESEDTSPVAQLSTLHSSNRNEYFRSVAKLGLDVARALQFAHEAGVVHRDVKPSNILLDTHGRIHIADFGLARILANDSITMTGDIVGTLRYMSPEQVEEGHSIDAKSDIYSLGATLYETLSGIPAVPAEQRAAVLRAITEEAPVALRRIDPKIPTDLSTIALKCLAKSQFERYQTAGEVADDLQRFLENKPIKARRSNVWQVARRWAVRHKALASTAAVAMITMLVLGIGGPLLAIRLQMALQAERQTSERLSEQAYDIRIRDTAHALGNMDLDRAEETLQVCPERFRDFEWFHLSDSVKRKRESIVSSQDWDVVRIALSPKGNQVVMGNMMGHLSLVDRDSRKHTGELTKMGLLPLALCYTADGRYLLAGAERRVRLWKTDDMGHPFSWSIDAHVSSGCFSPDAKYVAIGSMENYLDHENHRESINWIRVWETASAFDSPEAMQPFKTISGIVGAINSIAFAHDGRTLLASSSAKNVIRRWSFPALQELPPITVDEAYVETFAVCPSDDNVIAVSSGGKRGAGSRHSVSFYSLSEGQRLANVYRSTNYCDSIAFSPDGEELALGMNDGHVTCWKVSDLLSVDSVTTPRVIRAHRATVEDIKFADLSTIITAGDDGHTKEFSLTEEPSHIPGHHPFSAGVEFLSSDRYVTWGWDGRICLRQYPSHKLVAQLDAECRVEDLRLLTSTKKIAYVGKLESGGSEVAIWGTTSGTKRVLATLPGAYVRTLEASKDETKLVVGTGPNDDNETGPRIVVVDLATGDIETQGEFGNYHQLAIARQPGSDVLAAAEFLPKPRIVFWDIQKKKQVGQLGCGSHSIWQLAFSDQGQLAASTKSGDILLWDDPSNDRFKVLRGHMQNAFHLRFDRDGSRLASSALDGSARLWNTRTGNELLQWKADAAWTYRVSFSPDEQALAIAAGIGTSFGPIHLIHAPQKLQVSHGKP